MTTQTGSSKREPATIEIKGTTYTLAFPSLRQLTKAGYAIGIDVAREGADKIKWADFFSDEKKILEVLGLMLVEPLPEEILDQVTPSDLVAIVNSFFLSGQRVMIGTKNGLAGLPDFINAGLSDRFRPGDSGSTTPSTPLPKETLS